jgi:hypothetical protein
MKCCKTETSGNNGANSRSRGQQDPQAALQLIRVYQQQAEQSKTGKKPIGYASAQFKLG